MLAYPKRGRAAFEMEFGSSKLAHFAHRLHPIALRLFNLNFLILTEVLRTIVQNEKLEYERKIDKYVPPSDTHNADSILTKFRRKKRESYCNRKQHHTWPSDLVIVKKFTYIDTKRKNIVYITS